MTGFQYTVWADTPEQARDVLVEYLLERAAMRKGHGPMSRRKQDIAINEAVVAELTSVANFLTTVHIRPTKKEKKPDADSEPSTE